MWIFFLALVVILGGIKFITKLHPFEYLIQIAVAAVLTFFFWLFTFIPYSTWDNEVWNGSITDKQHVVKTCPNNNRWISSRDSFCDNYKTREVWAGQTCTGEGSSRMCTNNYNTEYRYIFPTEGRWMLAASNLKQSWEIERVDKRGMTPPPFYTSVNVGDPASITNGYLNWVKGAADSLFHQDGKVEEKYQAIMPEYPIKLYDIFKLDRIVPVGVTIPNLKQVNDHLSDALKALGPQKQMNAVIVVADATKISEDFSFAVRRAWQGFKKNDAVIFIGTNDSKIQWVRVMSWSKEAIFDVTLRESILADYGKPLDLINVIDKLSTTGLQFYKRRPMEEFEYLKDSIPTPVWLIVLFVILQILVAAFSIAFFHRHDPLGLRLSKFNPTKWRQRYGY